MDADEVVHRYSAMHGVIKSHALAPRIIDVVDDSESGSDKAFPRRTL
jgi:hypothetical protein